MKSVIAIFLAVLHCRLTVSADSKLNGVYMCSQDNWRGKCKWNPVAYQDYKKCLPMYSGEGVIGSIGPDRDIWIQVYSDSECKNVPLLNGLKNPGQKDQIAWFNMNKALSVAYVKVHDPKVDANQSS